MAEWEKKLVLDEHRQCIYGSSDTLCEAIDNGADLRVATAFRFNEHIDTDSDNGELVREYMDFRVTYLINNNWVAGIETLRMPVALPDGFGPRESMSFFVYNQDGHQAVGRPYLDGKAPENCEADPVSRQNDSMPKMKLFGVADENTNAPSLDFVYGFDYYKFFVCDRWHQVLKHDEQGKVISGSFDSLVAAVMEGREVKIAVKNLCDDFGEGLSHEVFVHIGPCYYHTQSGFLIGAANPLVRIYPSVPLVYRSGAWDFGWITARTDGFVARWLCNPYTLKFSKSNSRHAIRWFVDDSKMPQ